MRIGVLSGTFDPVHRGHVAFALAAIKQCRLDKAVFLPEASPRGKVGVSSFEHRLAMLKLAARQSRKLEVLALEQPRFSVKETLPLLQARFKGEALVLLCGSDLVRTFGFRWPGLDTLLAQCELAVSLRAGESQADLEVFLTNLAIEPRITFVEGPHAHLTATQVRAGDLLGIDPLVRAYIKANQLYGPA